ncbi:acyl-CoA dehydrogenase/oxidase [Parasitella parasitica]|nr:acyl-CoA dehydrogenase/oxidase [Parasitella parasitica]
MVQKVRKSKKKVDSKPNTSNNATSLTSRSQKQPTSSGEDELEPNNQEWTPIQLEQIELSKKLDNYIGGFQKKVLRLNFQPSNRELVILFIMNLHPRWRRMVEPVELSCSTWVEAAAFARLHCARVSAILGCESRSDAIFKTSDSKALRDSGYFAPDNSEQKFDTSVSISHLLKPEDDTTCDQSDTENKTESLPLPVTAATNPVASSSAPEPASAPPPGDQKQSLNESKKTADDASDAKAAAKDRVKASSAVSSSTSHSSTSESSQASKPDARGAAAPSSSSLHTKAQIPTTVQPATKNRKEKKAQNQLQQQKKQLEKMSAITPDQMGTLLTNVPEKHLGVNLTFLELPINGKKVKGLLAKMSWGSSAISIECATRLGLEMKPNDYLCICTDFGYVDSVGVLTLPIHHPADPTSTKSEMDIQVLPMIYGGKRYSIEEVTKHKQGDDCWIIVHDKVYDISKFLNDHPGGKKVLLKAAGTDTSKQFDAFHSPSVLTKIASKYLIGEVGLETAEETDTDEVVDQNPLQVGELYGDCIPFGDPMWYQDWYSPYYNDSHRAVRQAVREFVERDIMPFTHEWDEAKALPREIYEKAAKAGILASCVGHVVSQYVPYALPGAIAPEVFDTFHHIVVADELSRCASGGASHLGSYWRLGIGLPLILHFGSKYLKDKIVKDCLAGTKNICLAITEPSGGSDVAGLLIEAKDMGDHYLVNGEKKWITNGTFADYMTVAVRTGEQGSGFNGISFLLIERDMSGVTTRKMKCSGVWPSGTAYIRFECNVLNKLIEQQCSSKAKLDVCVPKENLIGKENRGLKYIMHNFNSGRLAIVIQATRFSRVCIEELIKVRNMLLLACLLIPYKVLAKLVPTS